MREFIGEKKENMFKIKGYSLPWSLFIMVIVSIMLSTLVISSNLFKDISNKLRLQCQLSDDLNYSIDYVISQYQEYEDSIQLNGPEFLQLKKTPWGVFNIIAAKGVYHKFSESKVVLSSQILYCKDYPALAVKSARNVLSITGDTKIKGRVFAPKGYLDRAYIEGKTYSGNELVEGKVENIESFIDHFDGKLFQRRMSDFLELKNGVITELNFQNIDSINNSFFSKTRILYHKKGIVLDNIKIIGNFIIKSDSFVIISSNCKITNSIIIAPKVIIENDFQGSLQVIASDSIAIGNNSSLLFPSALVLTGSKTFNPTISIGKDVCLDGLVIAYSDNLINTNSIINVQNNSKINGLIYSNSRVDFKGNIDGVMICNKLVTKTNSSYYDDILIDATIRNDKKTNFFIGGFAFGKDKSEQILIVL